MAENNQVEVKVTDTILEKAITVQVGSKTYEVAPPTIATLILASEAVSRIPKFTLDPEKLVQECFCIARHTRFLGEIAAILILGAQRSELRVKPAQRGVFSRLRALFSRRRTQKEQLTDEILLNLSPKKLFEVITQVLTTLELSDFFGLTTFLTEINLLHQTRKVED